ncbi:MAG: hypothetical protein LBG73_11325 [Spirochaetaceae bacterium]|jgi:hypothetical protein|nr:hypothetical protein [Spirochaetaceae bacterium]
MKLNFSVTRFLSALILALASGCVPIEETTDIPAELAGKWYDKDYFFTFEITEDGEGYIAEKRLHYAVTIAGSHVRFKDEETSSEKGSFYYSIDGGKMIMKTASGVFDALEAGSPFMKSNSSPQDHGPPVEFIGNWYSINHPSTTPNFTITADKKITISGYEAPYNVVISENILSVFTGNSNLEGTFHYLIRYNESIKYDEMSVSGGTDICTGLSLLSPFAKKN